MIPDGVQLLGKRGILGKLLRYVLGLVSGPDSYTNSGVYIRRLRWYLSGMLWMPWRVKKAKGWQKELWWDTLISCTKNREISSWVSIPFLSNCSTKNLKTTFLGAVASDWCLWMQVHVIKSCFFFLDKTEHTWHVFQFLCSGGEFKTLKKSSPPWIISSDIWLDSYRWSHVESSLSHKSIWLVIPK